MTKKEDQALEAGLFDFESLLSQCRPSTLWGIELQRKGVPKGWNDVGGLNEVRRSLLQTLQWPAKVSLVFFNDGSGINRHPKPGFWKYCGEMDFVWQVEQGFSSFFAIFCHIDDFSFQSRVCQIVKCAEKL